MPQKSDQIPDDLRLVIQKMIAAGEPEQAIASVIRAHANGTLKTSGDIPSSGPSDKPYGPAAPPPKYTGPDTFWGGFGQSMKQGGEGYNRMMDSFKGFDKGAILDIPQTLWGGMKLGDQLATGQKSYIDVGKDIYEGLKRVPDAYRHSGESPENAEAWGRGLGQIFGQPVVMSGIHEYGPPAIRGAGPSIEKFGQRLMGTLGKAPPYTVPMKFRWGGGVTGKGLELLGNKMQEFGLNPEQLRDFRLESSPNVKYTPSSETPRDLQPGETVTDDLRDFYGGDKTSTGGPTSPVVTTPEQDLVDKMLAWDRSGTNTKSTSINELGRQFGEKIPEGTDLGFKKGTRRQPQLPFDDVPSGSPWSGPDKPPSTPRPKRGPRLPFEGSESGVGPESPEGELVATPDGGFKWVSKSEVRSQVGGREPGPSSANDTGGPSESWKASWTKLNKMLGRDPSAAEIEADMARAPKEGEKTGQVAGFPPKFDDPSREWYQLPNGQIIPVDSTATKGVKSFDFQMKGGEMVKATRIDQPEIEPHGMYGPEYKANPRTNATDKFGPKPDIPPTDKWDMPELNDPNKLREFLSYDLAPDVRRIIEARIRQLGGEVPPSNEAPFPNKINENWDLSGEQGQGKTPPQNDISGVRTRNTLGPREVTPTDTPVQPRMGQQELPLGPSGGRPPVDEFGIPQNRDWSQEDIFRINHEMKNMSPVPPKPQVPEPQQMNIPEIGDDAVQRYLQQEDATPPEMVDLPKHSPDKLTLMQRLRDMLDQEEYA